MLREVNVVMPTLLRVAVVAALVFVAGCSEPQLLPLPQIEWDPERFVCYRTEAPPTIDGLLDEPSWNRVTWTEEFVDIRGKDQPWPRYSTRAAMLWDDENFYVAAKLQEPHVWATLEERDTVIYQDNDFELFIDPDGDTQQYLELEINAFGTVWDLWLTSPYRDLGRARTDWNFEGLESAVQVDGTINDPSDEDRGWSIEIAIPWASMAEQANRETPPSPGDQWRVNFSRVEWQVQVTDAGYEKQEIPEDNWVWSPQGLIDMHYPEMWGFVQFSGLVVGQGEESFVERPAERARWALRQLYYAERNWHAKHGRYCYKLEQLELADPELEGWSWPPVIEVSDKSYVAKITADDGSTMKIWHHGLMR